MLALQIILTALAWRKGWGAWALLPAGLGVLASSVIGAVGGLDPWFNPALLVPDFARLMALIAMSAYPPSVALGRSPA